MLVRFRTWETLLLLVTALSVIIGVALRIHLGALLTGALAVSFLLFAYIPLAARLQDRLIEGSLARGRFANALRIASAIRDGARGPSAKGMADFDIGLIHLSRGSNSDAIRTFRRIDGSKLQPRMRLLIATYSALAALRSSDDESRKAAAESLMAAVDAARPTLGESPYLLAAQGEGLLALARAEEAATILKRSIELDPDPSDPSPGERHVLLARAELLVGAPTHAAEAFRVAAGLAVDGPFVRAARAELARLG